MTDVRGFRLYILCSLTLLCLTYSDPEWLPFRIADYQQVPAALFAWAGVVTTILVFFLAPAIALAELANSYKSAALRTILVGPSVYVHAGLLLLAGVGLPIWTALGGSHLQQRLALVVAPLSLASVPFALVAIMRLRDPSYIARRTVRAEHSRAVGAKQAIALSELLPAVRSDAATFGDVLSTLRLRVCREDGFELWVEQGIPFIVDELHESTTTAQFDDVVRLLEETIESPLLTSWWLARQLLVRLAEGVPTEDLIDVRKLNTQRLRLITSLLERLGSEDDRWSESAGVAMRLAESGFVPPSPPNRPRFRMTILTDDDRQGSVLIDDLQCELLRVLRRSIELTIERCSRRSSALYAYGDLQEADAGLLRELLELLMRISLTTRNHSFASMLSATCWASILSAACEAEISQIRQLVGDSYAEVVKACLLQERDSQVGTILRAHVDELCRLARDAKKNVCVRLLSEFNLVTNTIDRDLSRDACGHAAFERLDIACDYTTESWEAFIDLLATGDWDVTEIDQLFRQIMDATRVGITMSRFGESMALATIRVVWPDAARSHATSAAARKAALGVLADGFSYRADRALLLIAISLEIWITSDPSRSPEHLKDTRAEELDRALTLFEEERKRATTTGDSPRCAHLLQVLDPWVRDAGRQAGRPVRTPGLSSFPMARNTVGTGALPPVPYAPRLRGRIFGVDDGHDEFAVLVEDDYSLRLLLNRALEPHDFSWGYGGGGPHRLWGRTMVEVYGNQRLCTVCLGALWRPRAGYPSCPGCGSRDSDWRKPLRAAVPATAQLFERLTSSDKDPEIVEIWASNGGD